MKHLLLTLFIILNVSVWGANPMSISNVFNVRDYGAKGDGIHVDSKAINDAIIAANQAGGGIVYVPSGSYICGSIHLMDNIHLYLSIGCKLIASDNSNLYDPEESKPQSPYQDRGHTYFENSLIWGRNLKNVVISGCGLIDGAGLVTFSDRPGSYGKANKAICIVESHNVQIKDITIVRGGHFAILLTGCNKVTLDNLIIDTNRDGIDIDCCTNTIVSNCKVNSPYDDAICPKSSFALGRKIVTENLSIINCQVSAFKEGTLLDGTMQPHPVTWWTSRSGRIKFGTESNGGFRNCVVSNCTFHSCKGLALEQVDGGVLENITITNLAMYNIDDYPIYVQLGERLRDPNKKSHSVGKNIKISNVVAYVADSLSGIHISGTKKFMLEDVYLSNIKVTYKGGATMTDSKFPEIGESYPEIGAFGKLVPSYGVFARHINGFYLDNVHVKLENRDMRPAVYIYNANNVEIDKFKADITEGIQVAKFENVNNLKIYHTPVLNNF